MIKPSRLFVAIEPIDLRKGVDSLMALARQTAQENFVEQAAWVFRNKSGSRIKVIYWDGLGFWLCIRRLDQGRFHWPERTAAIFELTYEQFLWLVDGIDWRRFSKGQRVMASGF